jgi:hypothetical protein
MNKFKNIKIKMKLEERTKYSKNPIFNLNNIIKKAENFTEFIFSFCFDLNYIK